MRNFLLKALLPRCAHVVCAATAEDADALVRAQRFDLVILDITLPGKSGIAWLRELREQGNSCEVVLITAFADLDTAIEALRAGASDFILKPFRLSQILNAVKQSLERSALARENYVLQRSPVGAHAAAARRTRRPLSRRSACSRSSFSSSPRSIQTVLLTGESGTGKELAAHALHRRSPRGRGPFVTVNCATMSPELLERELFGHAKGAFAGATKARDGLFYYAQGGTLFLDEIAELPLALQTTLLRVLDDQLHPPARQRAAGARRCAHRGGNEPLAGGRGRRRTLPQGPVLPAAGGRNPPAAAA